MGTKLSSEYISRCYSGPGKTSKEMIPDKAQEADAGCEACTRLPTTRTNKNM